MSKLSEDVRYDLRMFAFFLANGTIDPEIIEVDGNDYDEIFSDSTCLQRVFAIWGNLLEIDESGDTLNSGQAKRRAAQYIRSYIDSSYIVEPPFEEWELEESADSYTEISPPKLPKSVRSELCKFAGCIAARAFDPDVIKADTPDYEHLFSYGSSLEQVFAIWGNVLEIGENGEVLNAEYAIRRASQYIRSYIDSSYVEEPPFEPWEVELH